MSADLGRIHADSHESLPDLVAEDGTANPHSVTARARTGTNVELRIDTSTAPFDVAAEAWVPASAGTVVTVVVRTVDASTGQPRHLPPAEPNEWARAIFSTVDSTSGYFLGAVDPDTGTHRSGQFAYRLYLDTSRRVIPVPSQVVTCPHYPLSSVDGQPETTVPMVD